MIVRTASNLRATLLTLVASASASTDYVSWRQVSAASELGSGDPGFEATGPSARGAMASTHQPLAETAALGDNKAMYKAVTKEGTTSRTRYFERATIFVKYAILRRIIKSYLVPTTEMVADIFTKAVDAQTFAKMTREMCHRVPWTAETVHAKASRLLRALERTFSRA